MAKKAKEDWEKDFYAKTTAGKQKERIRQERKEQEERKIRQKEEERKEVERAKALNQLLEKASANIRYMVKKNQDFNQFLERLLRTGSFYLKTLNIGFGNFRSIFLYLYFNPENKAPSIGLSYSIVQKGEENKIITSFSPKANRDREFFLVLYNHDDDLAYILASLRLLASPESTIEFFSLYFGHLM